MRSMINSRSIWARLAITWKKKRPADVFVSIPSVMPWKCTFWASSSLTRSTNPFTLRPSRSSFHTTRVSAWRNWDSASFSPGRSTCAPLSLSVKMRFHPVFLSASSCISRFCSWVDTRAYPIRRG